MKRTIHFTLAVLAFVVTCGLWPPPAQTSAHATSRPHCDEVGR